MTVLPLVVTTILTERITEVCTEAPVIYMSDMLETWEMSTQGKVGLDS